jgi:hypothetical protein
MTLRTHGPQPCRRHAGPWLPSSRYAADLRKYPSVMLSGAHTSRAIPAGVVSRWCQRDFDIGHASVAAPALPPARSSSAADLLRPSSDLDPQPPVTGARSIEVDGIEPVEGGDRVQETLDAEAGVLLACELEQDRPTEVPTKRRHVLAIPRSSSTERCEDLVRCELLQRQQRNTRLPANRAHAHVDRGIDPALLVLRLDRKASERVRHHLASTSDPGLDQRCEQPGAIGNPTGATRRVGDARGVGQSRPR